MSTLRERNRRRTREEIADTAVSLFEQHGYANTTVDQIATRAGVSMATFFRYFASKEEVLFADEDETALDLANRVADRRDPAQSLAAVTAPVAAYADSLGNGSVPRLTRMVMTTPELESRSLRMRLRWEHELARQFAREEDLSRPTLPQTVLASLAVACLTSALRHWQPEDEPALGDLVVRAFALAGDSGSDPRDRRHHLSH